MQQSTSLKIALAVTSALFISACGGGGSTTDTSTPSTVSLTLPFQAKAGTTDITCDATLTGLGSLSDSGKVADFAFYVHDIVLKTSDGKSITTTLDSNDFQDPRYGVALLDFQDKDTSCTGAAKPTNKEVKLKATVDPATVTGIEFKVGVPSEKNHHQASTAGAPYNRTGLFWAWQSGHKFMRLDVKPTNQVTKLDTTKVSTFNLHLGSTGCSGDPTAGAVVSCTSPNRPGVSLNGVTVTNLTTNPIVLDYAALVTGTNINQDTGGAVGCMSSQTDTDCPNIFGNLGLSFGLNPAGTQQAFRIQ